MIDSCLLYDWPLSTKGLTLVYYMIDPCRLNDWPPCLLYDWLLSTIWFDPCLLYDLTGGWKVMCNGRRILPIFSTYKNKKKSPNSILAPKNNTKNKTKNTIWRTRRSWLHGVRSLILIITEPTNTPSWFWQYKKQYKKSPNQPTHLVDFDNTKNNTKNHRTNQHT